MKWIATLVDGTILKEGLDMNFSQLDLTKVANFKLVDEREDFLVPFKGDSGILDFPNLDLSKISKFTGEEELKFYYDKKQQSFRMDPKSLELYESIILKNVEQPFFIEILENGHFSVNGEDLSMGIEINSKVFWLENEGPYNNIIHYKTGYTDLRMKNSEPINRVNKVSSYVIGYFHKYMIDHLCFEVNYELIYNVESRVIVLNFIIIPRFDSSAIIHFRFENKINKMPVKLTKEIPLQVKRTLMFYS